MHKIFAYFAVSVHFMRVGRRFIALVALVPWMIDRPTPDMLKMGTRAPWKEQMATLGLQIRHRFI